jgi:hypothetical protein
MDGHDRNAVKEKPVNTTIDSDKDKEAPEAAQSKVKPAKKTKATKKKGTTKKPASKNKAARANKKAEVIALMKRTKGAMLAEIMAATKWQAHTVRGFVSILGTKGGAKIDSSKNTAGERTYKIVK